MWPTQVPHPVPLLLALHGRDELLHCASVLRSLEAVQHPNTQVGGSLCDPPLHWNRQAGRHCS
jgi:hypothetical protein